MQLTLSPRDAHSHAIDCVILTTAAFEQLYAACFCGCGTSSDAIDAVLMILPEPRASMWRASAWQHANTPRVLSANVRSQSESGVSSAAEFLLTPALFTAMSSWPHRDTTASTIAPIS